MGHMSEACASFERLFPDIAGNFWKFSYIENGLPQFRGQPVGGIPLLYLEDSNLIIGRVI
jgi:hypothetical protein